ncbi:hypothetical protein ACQY0O_007743 [Thecaphora frezii]
MSHLAKSPLPILKKLSTSLTSLDTILHPLLEGYTLEDITNNLQFGEDGADRNDDDLAGRLDSARLQVSVAYVLLDLVWIYLKTKGINPTTHPVMGELERVKSYFAKIKAVQNRENEEAHMKLDKSAAGRFIRAALSGNDSSPSSATSAAAAAAGKHTKFDDDEDEDKDSNPQPKDGNNEAEKQGKDDKARPKMDPFKGYDQPTTPAKRKADDDTQEQTPVEKAAKQTPSSASASAQKKKKKGKK